MQQLHGVESPSANRRQRAVGEHAGYWSVPSRSDQSERGLKISTRKPPEFSSSVFLSLVWCLTTETDDTCDRNLLVYRVGHQRNRRMTAAVKLIQCWRKTDPVPTSRGIITKVCLCQTKVQYVERPRFRPCLADNFFWF